MEVEGLTVHDLHPPAEVVSAYHDVARAIQARDQQVNRAEAQATQLRKQAEEEALREVADAEAARSRQDRNGQGGPRHVPLLAQLRTELPPEEMSQFPDEAQPAGGDCAAQAADRIAAGLGGAGRGPPRPGQGDRRRRRAEGPPACVSGRSRFPAAGADRPEADGRGANLSYDETRLAGRRRRAPARSGASPPFTRWTRPSSAT